MRWLISSSLRLAAAVVVAALVVLALGIGSLRHAAVDTLPEFLPPQVQVQTSAVGLSTNEVEQLITVPMEDQLNGVAFLDHMRSQSVPGLSTIQLTFKPGTDVYQARQLVQERVSQGPAVVNVGTPPVMIQPLSAESRAMMIGLSSTSVSPLNLSTLARWRIRPRLLAVPGVANVTIWGERDQQLQVLVDPATLHAHGTTLTQIINTAGDAMWTSPLTFVEASTPGADGFIDTPNQRLSVQHILPISTPQELARVPLEVDTGISKLKLGDVTTVVEDHPALAGDAVLTSQAGTGTGFLLVVEKFPGANTLAVDRGVQQAMSELSPGLAGVSVDTQVYRPASYLHSALHNLGWAGVAGLVLLMLWIGLVWRSWRVAVVAFVGIGLPLVVAAWVLELRGETFTLLTFSGLAVALAVVVDDAVSAVAALQGGLDAAGADAAVTIADGRDSREGRAHAITEALLGVRRPLGFALAVILLAGVPLLLVPGSNGDLTRPMLFTYLLTVLAATAVALTVTPALGLLLLRRAPEQRSTPPVVRWIRTGYDRVGPALVGRRGVAVGLAAVLGLAALAIIPQFGSGGLLPVLQDRTLIVQWSAAPGTSLPAMRQITQTAGAELQRVGGVTDVASDIGQALMGDQIVDVDKAQTWITVSGSASLGSTRSAIQTVLGHYPSLRHQLLTYSQTSLAQAPRSDTDPGGSAPLTVRLYGTDWATLNTEAQKLAGVVDHLPGVSGASFRLPTQEPSILINTNVDNAAKYGLKPGDIRRATAVLISGIPVGSYYQQQQIFDVAVWSVPSDRSNLGEIQNLLLDTPSGGVVPLKDVASVTVAPAPKEVDHDQASRYLDITANVRGQDLSTTVSRVQNAVQGVALPLGYHAEASSGLNEQQNGALRIILVVLGCLIGTLLLFQAAFRNWSRAALLLLSLPLSLAGGALTALFAGRTLTAGTLIGFLGVFAFAVRGGLLVLRRAQQLDAEGRPDAALAAAREASVPLVASAVGLILLVLPFTVRGDIAGTELVRPLSLVLIGGVITATVVTLLLLPAFAGQGRRDEVGLPPGGGFDGDFGGATPAVAGAGQAGAGQAGAGQAGMGFVAGPDGPSATALGDRPGDGSGVSSGDGVGAGAVDGTGTGTGSGEVGGQGRGDGSSAEPDGPRGSRGGEGERS
ncbi:efflux RND transporter permease subunit [Streptacidiphilus fuscans]|uniref:Efflux RND transporter permease subunit n=1 Tax=Streptacidiphilus fuscans TaxID=2789292 RepID=A0A931B537_9ACTN|nr:efflux RND transporter permease subunit [Streptacidiphilus fuscans]MBF9070438.1 efflux RND transporter permease subunit [Streptacidiphilus fuscans]